MRRNYARKTRSGGNYRERKSTLSELTVKDLVNPWNFYALFGSEDTTVLEWLRENSLLARTLVCDHVVDGAICGGIMNIKVRAERKGGEIFRCSKNRSHVKTILANSFFEKTRLEIQDVVVFIKSYLDKNSLLQCANFSGVSYKSTAVDWASYMREMFKEYFHRRTRNKVLGGVVEIDESLFGRRVKYHKGNPNKGMKVWIFGLVDREANNVILYPVSDRTRETLLPLIQRHVAPGSTIYSDGWSAYFNLNDVGYRHFTVLHKYAFRKDYIDTETGARTTVHTNRIEGAWKHAKDHFRRIVGTKAGQFEGHLAEIMWRSEVKGDNYEQFFQLLRECYPLDKPAEYRYTTPLFDSWEGPSSPDDDDEDTDSAERILPLDSGAETSGSEIGDPVPGPRQPMPRPRSHIDNIQFVVSSSSDEESLDRTVMNSLIEVSSVNDDVESGPSLPLRTLEHTSEMNSTVQATFTDSRPTFQREGPNIKITKRKSTNNKTNIVCCPSGFREEKQERHRSLQNRRQSNQYKKSAFRWDFSDSDEDFLETTIRSSSKDSKKGPNIKVTKRKSPKNLTDNVCHPKGFVQEKEEGAEIASHQRRQSNPYKKSAFQWDFSDSDDDFA